MNDTPQEPATELDGMAPTLLMAAGIPPAAPRAQSGPWEPPAPEQLAGSIPGIQITEFLGRGGMGAVYMGTQLSLDRPVAVKILATHLAEDPEFELRFQREAKSMARLNHPNIVQIFDYGRTETGWHYLVMEYVDGSDLSGLVRSGRLDAEGALNAVSQICAALQYAHELGFVHRDIKPANVFITQQGILKVGDFGLAKLMGSSPEDDAAAENFTLTRPGAIMGTPSYAAPEQMGGAAVDHRADLYSLGVMFYEMLTREIPRGAPRPPSVKVATLDVRIDGVVFKAMDPDPDGRYQTATDLRTDVDIIRTTPPGSSVEPSPPAPAYIAPPPPAAYDADILRTTRSLSTTTLILGLIALLTLGALAFFLAQRKTGDTITTETTVTNSSTNNTYFTQLIAAGLTTAKDLESIGDILPYHEGFIGISREPVTWEEAEALASRAGGEVLLLPEEGKAALIEWVSTSFPRELAATTWVRTASGHAYMQGAQLQTSTDAGSTRTVLIQWGFTPPSPPPPPLPEPEPAPAPLPAPEPEPAAHSISPLPPITAGLKEFTNSLGMKFVLIKDAAVLFCIHETRRQDYEAFARETPGTNMAWKSVAFYGVPCGHENNHPVVGVDWKEATAFCAWLSRKEGRAYRLPTDREWSCAVGLGTIEKPTAESTPASLSSKIRGVFPWGSKYPPSGKGGYGNLADSEMFMVLPNRDYIRDYSDGFGTTAPVMSFNENSQGLFDMEGNVVEWVADGWNPQPTFKVVRGASYRTSPIGKFHLSSFRDGIEANRREDCMGFRVVAVPSAEQPAPPAIRGPIPWQNKDGKTIQATFIQLSGEAVVVEMNGKQFTIPFSKLTPASVLRAQQLAAP